MIKNQAYLSVENLELVSIYLGKVKILKFAQYEGDEDVKEYIYKQAEETHDCCAYDTQILISCHSNKKLQYLQLIIKPPYNETETVFLDDVHS